MSSTTRKTEVVIVGGSSGATLARALSDARQRFDPAKHNLTLINQLPYSIFPVSSARMIVTAEQNIDSVESGGIARLDKLFKPGNAGRFVQGKVTRVLDDRVELADGTSVPYDYLALATGSKWSGPVNFDYTSDAEVRSHISDWRQKIASSKHVVVVGGGAVGLELVGEIAHYHPDATITLVHAAPKLLNDTYPDKFRNALATKLQSKGVRLVLEERVINLPPQGLSSETLKGGKTGGVQVEMESGRTLDADLVIPSLGARPNTSILSSFHNGAALTPSGYVRVTPSLNVKFGGDDNVAENIFAIGDIIDWPEQHMLAKAGSHANVVCANILNALERDEARKAGKDIAKPNKVYKGFPEAILITDGPTGGSLYIPFLWGIILGDWVARFVKAGTLMVPMFRKGFGYA